MENVRLTFPRIDDGQFARDLSERPANRGQARAQRSIALVAILRQGEPDRDKVTTPRWQAGFDLAIGRALAVKVRTEGYNAMLAQAKQGLKFKDDKNDTWELRPADPVTIGSALAKDAADAKTYLERVVAEHTGTPWAVDAASELAPAARLGMAREISPTWPAASPAPKTATIARVRSDQNGPNRRANPAATRRRCSRLQPLIASPSGRGSESSSGEGLPSPRDDFLTDSPSHPSRTRHADRAGRSSRRSAPRQSRQTRARTAAPACPAPGMPLFTG